MSVDSSHRHDARLLTVEALAAVRGGKGDPTLIDVASQALEKVASELHERDAMGRAYAELSPLPRAVGHLVRWGNAVRNAEIDAARFLNAARQAARDFTRRAQTHATSADASLVDGEEESTGKENWPMKAQFVAVAASIESVTKVDDVETIASSLLATPLPMPIMQRRARGAPRPQSNPRGPLPAPPPVAFLAFRINGNAVGEPHILQPDVLYDLDIEVRLSRWPAVARRLEFSPIHVEPPATLLVPTFAFERPVSSSTEALTLRAVGRLRIHCAQDFLARPLEIRYVGAVEVESTDQTSENEEIEGRDESDLVVQGQRQLSLQSFDPRINPITGFREVDERLLGIRFEARQLGVSDPELADFLTLIGAAGRIAAQAITDDLYPGIWSEDEYHTNMRDRLRTAREIGAELQEHSTAGGGVTDLSFRRIPLELKADDLGGVTVDTSLERYGQQTIQYVAASDRRCGVLAVLDTEAKSTAPGSVYNDIALRVVAPPSGDGREILIGVVVVRGNLATPSELSKKSPKAKKKAGRARSLGRPTDNGSA